MFETAQRKAVDKSRAHAPAPNPVPASPLMLLIDDEPSVGRFLAHAAEECGCRALATISPESFRREYRLLRPDILALDLAIPGADGIELLRFLAQEKCEAPIIIISGFDRRVLDSAMRLGRALGLRMIGPLSKPVRLYELEALLETVKGSTR
ncbi:response regulator [Sphingosinicella rhizophila]|uniref:Response regulator n=1 Tax=Sphingosinicella rhizophila TaxID=3050082 RepID=A0ABU3Q3A8_9SPHN|nr:response regulator [Sphingosinicella sp. GR2756]MDT9597445.1 response regulator [Sphingosinicella sp. GR2756]